MININSKKICNKKDLSLFLISKYPIQELKTIAKWEFSMKIILFDIAKYDAHNVSISPKLDTLKSEKKKEKKYITRNIFMKLFKLFFMKS